MVVVVGLVAVEGLVVAPVVGLAMVEALVVGLEAAKDSGVVLVEVQVEALVVAVG